VKRRVLIGISSVLVAALVAVAAFAVFGSLAGRSTKAPVASGAPAAPSQVARGSVAIVKPPTRSGGAGAALAVKPGAGRRVAAQQPIPASVTLKYAPGASAASRAALTASLGLKVKHEFPGGWVVVESTKPGVTSASLAEAINASGAVATAAPTPRVTPAAFPTNDPYAQYQWDLLNTGQVIGGQPGISGDDIGWVGAWNRGATGAGVIVGVTDTGVDYQHEDLVSQMWSNPSPGSDPSYPGDVRGWNFFENTPNTFQPWDGDDHGTHVSGTIAAATNNGLGIAGIASGARIMSLKFIGPTSGSEADAVSAIDYAIAHGAKAINASWGDSTYSGNYQPLQDAIDRAAKAGVLFVAAAGNDATSALFYPAAYSLVETNVIAVAATDNRDTLASFSNFGTYPQLSAPGVDTMSSVPPLQAGVFINHAPFLVSYLAFPVEDVTSLPLRTSVVDRAMAALTSVKTAPVLVVDDSRADLTGETQGARLQPYLNALAADGYTAVTSWVIAAQGVPSTATMTGKTVVWFTGILDSSAGGYSGIGTLNATVRAQLGPFLDGGGHLFLSSASAVFDLTPGYGSTISDQTWLTNYLHVSLAATSNTNQADGRWDSPYSGLSPQLSDLRLNVDNCDAVLPADTSAVRTMDWHGSGYSNLYSGTSMATPHVTGVVALLESRFPGITALQVKNRILATVKPVPSLTGKVTPGSGFTPGRLDASAAVAPYAAQVTGLIATPTSDGTITLSWTNPVDAVYDRTVIRGRVGVDPTGPVDSTSRQVYSGTGSTVNDTGLAGGTQMHYMAYTHSTTGLWSDGVPVTATSVVANPGTLSGTVTSTAGGGAVAGVSVTVGAMSPVNTAADGTYTLTNLAPGTYTVVYAKTHYGTSTVTGIAITSNNTTTQNVVLSPNPGTLSGTVTSTAGGALAGVSVTVGVLPSATTAANGTYTVIGIAPGTYNVTYSKTTFATSSVAGITITSDNTTTQNVALTPTQVLLPVWRFFNLRNGTHFYTADPVEMAHVRDTMASTYHLDGVAYSVNTADPANSSPLWRFFDMANGSHFYTADPAEKARIQATMASTYSYDGPAYDVSLTDPTGSTTVWRFFDHANGSHFYTADPAEKASVQANLSAIYSLDGPAFYLVP
jgi:subtilisin family serine protease